VVKRKSQLSIEFIILTAFVLLAIIILLYVLHGRLGTAKSGQEDILVGKIKDNVLNEIMISARSYNGYSRNTTISSETISGNLTIAIENNQTLVIYYNGKWSSSRIPVNVSSDLNYDLPPGQSYFPLVIKKFNGIVTVSSS
jgi:uncharacterized protein (UPF0333 family)